MNTMIVPIPTKLISSWETFHDVFADALGFPPFYGRNMDAWIDCLTSADDPSAQMITRAVQPGELLTLQIDDVADFVARCPELIRALVECAAFVNHRRIEVGQRPVLSLMMSGYFA